MQDGVAALSHDDEAGLNGVCPVNDLFRGMAEDDINALKAAIASDDITSEVKNSKFGPTVKQWMQQMWGKALEASWNIDLGIVSGLLTTAIQKYYGWS